MKTITEWKSESGLTVDSSLEEDALRHIAGCCRQPEQSWIREPKCEVRPSKRHGLGLFATQDIKVWEVITLYPADGARLWLPDGRRGWGGRNSSLEMHVGISCRGRLDGGEWALGHSG